MMYGWGSYGHPGWMSLGWLVGLVVLAAVAGVAFAAARGREPADGPELILKRRYARGELDREEYERRLQDLRK